MSTEIAKVATGGLLAMMDRFADDIDNLGNELGVASGKYLKFSGKSGLFTYDGKIMPSGSVVAVNLIETTKGWICYMNGGIEGRFEERVFGGKPLPTPDELENTTDTSDAGEGDGWKSTMTFQVRLMENGDQTTMGFSSGGGVRAAVSLFKDIFAKQKMNLDDNGEPLIPLVEIGSEEKKLRKGPGSYFVPVLNVVGWASTDELKAEFSGAAAEEAEAPPPKPAPKAAKPASKIPGRATGFGSGVRGART